MGHINQCMNCGNTKEGGAIYKCQECGKIFCSNCMTYYAIGGSQCPNCKSTRKTKIGYISGRDDSSKPDCFITTATLLATYQQDDGITLTAFRNFRDQWLLSQPYGKELIEEYYEIAPKIVSNINSTSNAENIYQTIYSEYLADCYKFIENGNYNATFEKYKKMVLDLKGKYLN